jgi:integrase
LASFAFVVQLPGVVDLLRGQFRLAAKRHTSAFRVLHSGTGFESTEAQFFGGVVQRTDVWYMVRRRAADAGIETAIVCHTFRATGITDCLTNGGRIEVAQRMAGHSNAKRPIFITGAAMTSAWGQSSGSGFKF